MESKGRKSIGLKGGNIRLNIRIQLRGTSMMNKIRKRTPNKLALDPSMIIRVLHVEFPNGQVSSTSEEIDRIEGGEKNGERV